MLPYFNFNQLINNKLIKKILSKLLHNTLIISLKDHVHIFVFKRAKIRIKFVRVVESRTDSFLIVKKITISVPINKKVYTNASILLTVIN
jgi:hypothetical protein